MLPCHDLHLQFLPRRVQFVRAADGIVVDHNNRCPSSRTRWPDVDSMRYCLAQGNHFRCGTTANLENSIIMTWLLALVTTFAALRSAWYWYKSSQIYAVPYWVEVGRDEPKDPLQVQLGWMNALMKANGESAILNRWGALWTAGTVMLGAATTLANVWSS